jgi:hypothetical protein
MKQVAEVFTLRKGGPGGASKAAKDVNASLPSFYKYASGKSLPRMEVLKAAQQKWGVVWKLLNPTEILKARNLVSADQLPLPLDLIREEDVQIAQIIPMGDGSLRLTLNISLSSARRLQKASKVKR